MVGEAIATHEQSMTSKVRRDVFVCFVQSEHGNSSDQLISDICSTQREKEGERGRG